MAKKMNKQEMGKKEVSKQMRVLRDYKLKELDKTRIEFRNLSSKKKELSEKRHALELRIYNLHMEIDKLQKELEDLR